MKLIFGKSAKQNKSYNNSSVTRILIALIVSVVLHILIFIINSPAYKPVADLAMDFEIVDNEDEQPLVPDAIAPSDNASEQNETAPADLAANETTPDETAINEIAELPVLTTQEEIANLTKTDAGDAAEDKSETIADAGIEKLALAQMDAGEPTQPADSGVVPIAIANNKDAITNADAGISAFANADAGTKLASQQLDKDMINYSDAGLTVASASVDAGQGKGNKKDEEICFHDIFPYAEKNPSWILWMSMSSFRGTTYENGIAQALGGFSLYKKMVSATGIDPAKELEGLLVVANKVNDWDTYSIVTTYNIGESKLIKRLQKNKGSSPDFHLQKTTSGHEGWVSGEYRWHMVGDGRVMVATHEKNKKVNSSKQNATAKTISSKQLKDNKKIFAPSFPHWPRNVTCMRPRKSAPEQSLFNKRVRASIEPSEDDRWPVALIATQDPDAVGLRYNKKLAHIFKWVIVKGYFSDPIRIEGVVQFSGNKSDMKYVESTAQRLLEKAKSSTWLQIAGLGSIFKNIKYEMIGNQLKFVAPLKESQIHAGLLFLRLQSQKFNKQMQKKSTN